MMRNQHLLNYFYIKLLNADKGRLPFFSMLPYLSFSNLVMAKHYLDSIVFSTKYNVMPTVIFLLSHLPLVPFGGKSIFPTLAYHSLHLFLQILSDAPKTYVWLLDLAIHKNLHMIIA